MSKSSRERPAVVTALPEEIEPFRRIIPGVAEVPHSGAGRFYAGQLTSQDVLLGWTGDGRRAAREGIEALFAEHEVSHLLVMGVAGGLTEGLGFGHLVVAREVRDAEGVVEPGPDPVWIERAMNLPGLREAVVYSHDRIVSTAAEKDALGRRLLGESETRTGAAVVDLETATFARTAAAHGVPYTAIRAVSDGPNEDLPVDFNRFLDGDGRTRRGRVALYALTHPGLIVRLLNLRARVRWCARRLNDAAIFVLLSPAVPGGPPGGFGRMMVDAG